MQYLDKKPSGIRKVTAVILSLMVVVYLVSSIIYLFGSDVPRIFIDFVIFLDFILIMNLVSSMTKRGLYKLTFIIYIISTLFMLISFMFLYMKTGVFVGDSILVKDKFSCFYFSVITWTSLGYGDIFPTEESRVTVMVEVFLGYIHMGLLVGLLLDYITVKRSD